ncbi:MAG: patatin-like phospholipase family protein [Lewinellaceae bacterium]|nr:patatin-like phospholipase family protein [Lewinellaceae bacterium]
MIRQHLNTWILIGSACCALTGCSPKIYTDRTQFLADGVPAPGVDLSAYRSVQERPNQDATMAVGMCISGGGSRAANFGVGVMLGLEQIGVANGQNALDQVDYLSTVSGGGFAGGALINARYEHAYFERTTPFYFRDYVYQEVKKDLSVSYVRPILFSSINPLLLFTPIDDGDALERAIDNHVLGYKRRRGGSIRLGDMFVAASDTTHRVTLPYHITNSSVVSTMSIFPFTPDVLSDYYIDGYSHRMRRFYSDGTFDPFRVPLAVGIKASGSFPVLISNTTLRSRYHPNRKFLHIIDGAMTDNLGFYTAVDILRQDAAPRKILFIVDADNVGNISTFSKRERSIWSLKIAAKLPGSGLTARRSILVNELENLEKDQGIFPFFFGFNALIKDNPAALPEVIDPRVEMPRLAEAIKLQGTQISDTDKLILFELLTNIGTKYTIKKDEQELLIQAGRLIVLIQEAEIKAALLR